MVTNGKKRFSSNNNSTVTKRKKLSEKAKFTVAEFKVLLKNPASKYIAFEKFNETVHNPKSDSVDNAENLVACYLRSSPELGDILQVIEDKDVYSKPEISHILLTIRNISDALAKEDVKKMFPSVADNLCKELANGHLQKIYHLVFFGSSQIGEQALKLLASLSCLGMAVTHIIFTSITFVKEDVHAVLNEAKAGKIRQPYIAFLMALIENSSPTILKAIIDEKGLINSMFAKLSSDSYEVITRVLTVLNNRVVNNSHITKTQRVKLFNETTMPQILECFNWKKISHRTSDKIVKAEEEIQDLVVSFAKTLLSDQRKGITFHDPDFGFGERNMNHILSAILTKSVLKASYTNEKLEQLLISCLSCRPDQIHRYLSGLEESSLSYKNADSWRETANHLTKLYYSLPPLSAYLTDLSDSSLEKLCNLALAISIPRFSTMKIFKHVLTMTDISWQYTALGFFLVILRRCLQSLDYVKTLLSEEKYNQFGELFTVKLAQLFPPSEAIAQHWMCISKNSVEKFIEHSCSKAGYCDRLLDVINLYQDLSLLPQTSPAVNVVSILQDIKSFFPETSTDKSDQFSSLTVKALQLLRDISEETKLSVLRMKQANVTTLNMILHLIYTQADEVLQQQAKSLLSKLIIQTGWFVKLTEEVEIWLRLGSLHVISFMETCLLTLLSNPYPYLDQIYEAIVAAGSHMKSGKADLIRPLPFSLLIPIAAKLHSENQHNNEYVNQYLDGVISELLLIQDDPLILCHMVLPYKSLEVASCAKYLSNDKAIDHVPEILCKSDTIGLWKTLMCCKCSSLDPNQLLALSGSITSLTNEHSKDVAMSHLLLAIWHHQGDKHFSSFCCHVTSLFKSLCITRTLLTRLLQSGVVHKHFLSADKSLDSEAITKLCLDILSDVRPSEIKQLAVSIQVYCDRLGCLLLDSSKGKTKFSKKEMKRMELMLQALDIMSCLLSASELHKIVTELLAMPCMTAIKNFWICLKHCIEHMLQSHPSSFLDYSVIIKLLDNSCSSHHKYEIMEMISRHVMRNDLIPLSIAKDCLVSHGDVKPKPITDLLIYYISQSTNDVLEDLLAVWSSPDVWSKNPQIVNAFLSRSKDLVTKFMSAWHRFFEQLKSYIHGERDITCVEEIQVLHHLVPSCTEQQGSDLFSLLTSLDRCYKNETVLFLLKALAERLPNVSHKLYLLLIESVTELDDNIVHVLVEKFTLHMDDSSLALFRKSMKNTFKDFCFKALRKNYTKSDWIKFVLQICKVLYSKESSDSVDLTSTDFYKMMMNHSKFLPVLMTTKDPETGSRKEHPAKESLLDLLIHIVTISPAVCSSDHFPIWLSSYNATLSSCDHKLLHLMYLYEENGVSTAKYRPYLWAEAGANHYSVKQNLTHSLTSQPSIESVLECIDRELLRRSACSLPLFRDVTPLQDYRSYEPTEEELYDPAFLLPLFAFIMRPDNSINTRQLVEVGVIEYTICCLTSHKEMIRSAARHILYEFKSHLESTVYTESIQGLYILDLLKESIPEKNGRLPPVTASFISQTLTLPPDDHMYRVCHNYLLIKPVMDLDIIPEFYRLFYSSSPKFTVERNWLLQLLRISLREDSDFRLFENLNAMRAIMSYAQGNLCTAQDKELVMDIIYRACRLPTSYKTMLKYNVVSWLAWMVIKDGESLKSAVKCMESLVNNIQKSCDIASPTWIASTLLSLLRSQRVNSVNAPDVLRVLYKSFLLIHNEGSCSSSIKMSYHNVISESDMKQLHLLVDFNVKDVKENLYRLDIIRLSLNAITSS